MLEGRPPAPRIGYCHETDLWDYKSDCPWPGKTAEIDNAWASVASDVMGFHNNRGGILFFGIDNNFKFVGATHPLDSKMFNDKMRRYLPDDIFVEYSREFIQYDQSYLGVALIPPRGPMPACFQSSAPEINGRRIFEKNGTAIREGDATRILSPSDAAAWIRSLHIPTVGNTFAVDQPDFRILAPDYEEFIKRDELTGAIEKSLQDPRVSTTSLIGVGGMGKTALATWATLRAYEKNDFDFIVSMTAKDRELTSMGIVGIRPGLTSYERLLDNILETLQFSDLRSLETVEKSEQVKLLLESGRGLLCVDNLETVDDARIIEFLDNLPLGTRALITSRRSRVRVSARPIEVPQMGLAEVQAFIKMLAKQPNFRHIAGISAAEATRVGRAWNGIPLAIRWSLARSLSPAEAVAAADTASMARKHGDELLEFSFRRVFDHLRPVEQEVLQVLSVLQSSIPVEALIAATSRGTADVIDALDELTSDALVVREFDQDRNDYAYTLLPITRAFVQYDMHRNMVHVREITRKLTNWFEAVDLKDPEERLIVRQLRQGSSADDRTLIDLAASAERGRKLDTAEKLYRQALTRVPTSWRAMRALAEFLRHNKNDHTGALQLYRQAVANAPARGSDRALIFREYGILLKDSGEPDATSKAAEALRQALKETPNDKVAVGALAQVLDRMGASMEIIKLLEPHRDVGPSKFQVKTDPILLRAYERTSDLLKAAQLKRSMHQKD
jgi:tetratricopeptide (TPR) repeat protein